jgi:mono/diheme cytochrome c family protein
MVLLILITGHLGGSITHGSDYLTKPFSGNRNSKEIARKPIPDVQNSVVYTDIIQPMLQSKCYGCHGPNKQKGKLRLDAQDFILKGGEDGKVIVPGRADECDLIGRILLPKDDEDHMPPKEKSQLSKQDIDLLHWWVSNGADFNKKVNEFPQPDKIKPVLLALQSGAVKDESIASELPDKPVEKADDKIIQQLKDRSVSVAPVAAGSNYLSANFIAIDSVRQTDIKLLQSLKKQLLWLKLGNKKIAPSLFAELSSLNALTKIYLERTGINDEGLKAISNLPQLQYINLTGNPVTEKGIEQLKSLKGLAHLYVYRTSISAEGYGALKKLFPKASIDTGGYKVPVLPGDTTELKEAVKRN